MLKKPDEELLRVFSNGPRGGKLSEGQLDEKTALAWIPLYREFYEGFFGISDPVFLVDNLPSSNRNVRPLFVISSIMDEVVAYVAEICIPSLVEQIINGMAQSSDRKAWAFNYWVVLAKVDSPTNGSNGLTLKENLIVGLFLHWITGKEFDCRHLKVAKY